MAKVKITNQMQLLFATQNQAKLKEVRAILQLPRLQVLSASDLEVISDFDVEETGSTFAENAELKAQSFGDKTGLLTASDDSGLEINALDGRPSVHSKRFFAGSDEDRNAEVLRLLAEKEDRSAQFITVICLYDPQRQSKVFFEGVIKGKIANQTSGNQGFGYDPLFVPDGYQHTFAELGLELKNKLSHRAQALYQLKEYLERIT